jgi:DNA-binding NarL/FixJ family response regulator
MISAGATDDAIARTLGVGVRTIRRDVAELRTSLGVGTRTEIVAAAIRQGWL